MIAVCQCGLSQSLIKPLWVLYPKFFYIKCWSKRLSITSSSLDTVSPISNWWRWSKITNFSCWWFQFWNQNPIGIIKWTWDCSTYDYEFDHNEKEHEKNILKVQSKKNISTETLRQLLLKLCQPEHTRISTSSLVFFARQQ